jgi:flagellin
VRTANTWKEQTNISQYQGWCCTFKEEFIMALTVQHNMASANANRNLGVSTSALQKSTEKLSSGYRINRAGDDAAGLAISEKMRGQIRGLDKASSNSQDGISLIQTAEGALTETQSILQRMRELAVQAANDTNTDDDRTQIQNEIDQLTQEVDRIATSTEFNTKKLLDGSAAGAISQKDGTLKTDASFANSNVSLTVSAGALSAIMKSDVVRIELTSDITEISTGFSSGTTITALKSTSKGSSYATSASITISTTSDTVKIYVKEVKMSKGAAAVTNEALSSGDVTDLADSTNVITINNADKLKAGDVITLTFEATTVSRKANAGEAAYRLQVGANAGQEMQLGINSMKANALGIVQVLSDGDVGEALDVTTQNTASLAINAYDLALQRVSTERAKLGAVQNRLEHTIANLDTSSENLQSAESSLRDTDMAKEMTNYSKSNILMQAGQSMLAQANQANQGVLSLLQ